MRFAFIPSLADWQAKNVRISEHVETVRKAAKNALDKAHLAMVENMCFSGQGHCTIDGLDKNILASILLYGQLAIAVALTQALPEEVPRQLRVGRGWYEYVGLVDGAYRTRCGVVTIPRPCYRLAHGVGPVRLSPFDRTVGLASGRMSLTLQSISVLLATMLPFSVAKEVQELVGGYSPSTRSTQGIVDQWGPEAAAFLDSQGAPDDDGEILMLQMDGKGAPMMGIAEHAKRCRPHKKRPRGLTRGQRRQDRRRRRGIKRRASGKKSKNAKNATMLVVYTLRRHADGTIEGPINKRMIAGFCSPRALAKRAMKAVVARGYGKKETYFLSDGAVCLHNVHKEFFPESTACLDWYHMCEYLWKAGGTMYAKKSQDLNDWVEARKSELRMGNVSEAIDAIKELESEIPKKSARAKGRRDRMSTARKYLEKRKHLLCYKSLLDAGVDIATGAVEGAAKYAVGARFDGPGMRWSRERSEKLLQLRCVFVNGDWDELVEHVTEKHHRVRSPIIPRVTPIGRQTPYEAKKKVA